VSKPQSLAEEIRNAVVWLERQPGVTSVVHASSTGIGALGRSRRAPGEVTVLRVNGATVELRAYGSKSVRKLVVHCQAGPQRDRWVAAVVAGTPFESLPLEPTRDVAIRVARASALSTQVTPFVMPDPVVDPTVTPQLFDVTPELAVKWLERNTKNRDLRNDTVLKYSSDMKAGRWYISTDAIGFDTDDVCVNGQHRLWAILDSGTTQRMFVVFGLQPGVVQVLDTPVIRTLLDAAQLSDRPGGAALTTKHTAVVKRLILSQISATVVDSRAALARQSRQSQLDFLRLHGAAVDFEVREVFRKKVRLVTRAPVLAPVARAWYTQDKERLKHFGHVVTSGLTDYGAQDGAAVVLRNFLLRPEKQTEESVYKKTERALRAFLDSERLTTLYEATKELFPLPEEQAGKEGKA
jgi:hypothetical protein